MLEYKKRNLEGKRGYAIIDEEEKNVSPNQYAYYFGGIIRRECMASDVFKGYTEKQIHSLLFNELRSTVKGILKPDGTTKLVTMSEDFNSYKKEDMRLYMEELIPHLQTEYNIYVKPSSHYKYNKFYIDPKLMK
jgi:hypothetical protein